MTMITSDIEGNLPLKSIGLKVGSEIINGAQPCNPNGCMVAEALHRKYPEASYIWVDAERISFTLKGLRYTFLPPQSVKNYIARYDRGESVRPFSFRTNMLAKLMPGGEGAFHATHPKGDNRTNPRKVYNPAKKKRKYSTRVRVNGICQYIPI